MDQEKLMASGEYGTIKNCTDCTDTGLVTNCVCRKITVGWACSKNFRQKNPPPQKKNLEGSLGGRRQVGRPRNRWEDKVRKYAAKLVNTRNRCTAVEHEE